MPMSPPLQQPRGEAVIVDLHRRGGARPDCRPSRTTRPSASVTSSVPRCSCGAKAQRQPGQAGQFRKRRVYGFDVTEINSGMCDPSNVGLTRTSHGRSTLLQSLARADNAGAV